MKGLVKASGGYHKQQTTLENGYHGRQWNWTEWGPLRTDELLGSLANDLTGKYTTQSEWRQTYTTPKSTATTPWPTHAEGRRLSWPGKALVDVHKYTMPLLVG